MVLSDVQIKSILLQLGVPEEQVTKEIIEDIQMNCSRTMDIISYMKQYNLIPKRQGSSKTNDKLNGILIAASSQPRFDSLINKTDGKFVQMKDYKRVVYDEDSDMYILTDEQGNYMVDNEGNAVILNPIENYVGYVLVNNKIIPIKSSNKLPTEPCYVELTGRNYNGKLFVVNTIKSRELSDVELNILNDYIDNEIFQASEKVNNPCKFEPFIFIGKVRYVGMDKREDQPCRGKLDEVTVFTIGHGDNAVNIRANCREFTRNDAGIFIGMLSINKWTKKDGNVTLFRTVIHPVKLMR